ncbi:MAG TPA: glycerophosphoryl diester phosphodiesterase membrane domain-containing protein [Anaerolineales bacterium]|nr:glycerophosphoryl diester phosphodiesterase membrane domain-containing protein [Anaerolineales bacterium]
MSAVADSPPLAGLRPLSLGELLDQIIRVYRKDFLTLVGVVAVAQIPLMLAQLVTSLLTLGPTNRLLAEDAVLDPQAYDLAISNVLVSSGVNIFLTLLGLVLVQGFAAAVVARAVADRYSGEPAGILGTLRHLSGSWLRIGVLVILMLLSAFGLLLWAFVPCVGWVSGLGMLIFFFSALWPLAIPVAVIEGKTPWESLRRAWELARSRFWWVTGFVFILWLFAQLVVSGPSILVGVALQFVSGSPLDDYNTRLIVQSIISLVGSLVYLPIYLTGMTLLYLSLRVRSEGLDLRLMVHEARHETLGASGVLANAPPAASSGLPTWTELAYFVIMTVLIGGLLVILYVLLIALGILLVSAAAGT